MRGARSKLTAIRPAGLIRKDTTAALIAGFARRSGDGGSVLICDRRPGDALAEDQKSDRDRRTQGPWAVVFGADFINHRSEQ